MIFRSFGGWADIEKLKFLDNLTTLAIKRWFSVISYKLGATFKPFGTSLWYKSGLLDYIVLCWEVYVWVISTAQDVICVTAVQYITVIKI